MSESNDQIDEVALNVLLAEGLDVPTALEASRLPADEKAQPSVSLWAALVAIIAGLLVLWAVF